MRCFPTPHLSRWPGALVAALALTIGCKPVDPLEEDTDSLSDTDPSTDTDVATDTDTDTEPPGKLLVDREW